MVADVQPHPDPTPSLSGIARASRARPALSRRRASLELVRVGPEHRRPACPTTVGRTRHVLRRCHHPHLDLAHIGTGTDAPPRDPLLVGAYIQIWEEEAEAAEEEPRTGA